MATKYHIDKALKYYRHIVSFNLSVDVYTKSVYTFIKTHHKDLLNKRDINLFVNLLKGITTEIRKISYDKDNDAFSVDDSKEKTTIRYEGPPNFDSIDYAFWMAQKAKKSFDLNKSTEQIDEQKLICLLNAELPVEHKNRLIGHALTHCFEKDYDNLTFQLSHNLCFHILKSLLIGEYLIIDDYSQKISATEDDDFNENTEIILYRTSLYFKELLADIHAFCKTLRALLSSDNNTKFTVGVSTFNGHPSLQHNKYGFEIWRNGLSAMLTTIYIDHLFVTTTKNIYDLCCANNAFDNLKAYKWDREYGQHIVEEICNPAKKKIMFLLRQMIYHKAPYSDEELSIEYYFTNNTLYSTINAATLAHIYSESSPRPAFLALDKYLPNYYYKVDNNKLEITIPHKYEDIASFNNNINKVNNIYIKEDKLFKSINNNRIRYKANIKRLDNYIDKNNIFTIGFLYKCIKLIYNNIDTVESYRDAYFLILKLLDKLYDIISIYEMHSTLPTQMRLPFKYNYYKVENSYTVKYTLDINQKSGINKLFLEGEPVFFFVSMGFKPINVMFLKNFVVKYRHLIEKGHLQRSEDAINNKFKKERETHKEVLNQLMSRQKEDLSDIQNKNTQLLGFLGAFIAFVAMVATGFTKNMELSLFKNYLTCACACILLFVIMIRVITMPLSYKIRENKMHFICNLILIFVIIYTIISCLE